MEVRSRTGQAEGWQKDPYGRHELRFFDGQKWTPYVRDAGENGIDEPGGPMAEEAAAAVRSALLKEPVLVVERHVDHGRRTADRAVRRADGSVAGVLRHVHAGAKQAPLRSLVARDQLRHDSLELVDESDLVVFSLARPAGVPKTTLTVRDPDGRDAGRISQQSVRSGATTFALLGPNSAFLGDLRTENWVSWDLWIDDTRGRRVATITREWDGLDRGAFPSTDDYVVRIAQPVPEPLRTLVVAAAVALEVAVRPHSGG